MPDQTTSKNSMNGNYSHTPTTAKVRKFNWDVVAVDEYGHVFEVLNFGYDIIKVIFI